MRKLPPLNAIRVFEAAARNQSFTAAANELCVTVTAVSHQIRHLEEQIGTKLFDRTSRSVSLTAAGERLYPSLRDGFDLLSEAFEDIHARDAGTSITVSTTRAFAERWLMPRLGRFSKAHPHITINVEGTDNIVDLREGGIDLAIRYGRTVDGSLDRVPLMQDHFYVAVAKEAYSTGHSINHFTDIALLAYRWHNRSADAPNWAQWLRLGGYHNLPIFRISWYNEENLAIHAMERGLGPLLCSNVLIGDACRDGKAVRLDGPEINGFGYSIVSVSSRRLRPVINLFRDWLISEAEEFEVGRSQLLSQPHVGPKICDSFSMTGP